MRYLFQLFFLERFPWLASFLGQSTVTSVTYTQGEILHKAELEALVWFLQGELQEEVFYRVDLKGRVIVGTVDGIIGTISVHSKGALRRTTYIAVRLEDGYSMYQAWFQLAFVCFKVRFRKPTLTLLPVWKIPTRGH